MTPNHLVHYLNSPGASAINMSLAGIGILLAVYFYIKGKSVMKARYTLNSQTLIETRETTVLTGLEIHFRDIIQDRITVTKIGIWHAGNVPLRPEDVATASPLLLKIAPAAEVLATELLLTTDTDSRFQISNPERSAEHDSSHSTIIPFSFEYLDPQQGAVIQVVHTGSRNHKFRVTGKIIGASAVKSVTSPHHSEVTVYRMLGKIDYRLFEFIASVVFVVLGFALVAFPQMGYFVAGLGFLTLFIGFTDKGRIPKEIAGSLK